MNQSQRMQLKFFVSFLGILLLVIMFLGKIFVSFMTTPQEEKTPIVEKFRNVWIIEADAKQFMIYRDGVEESYLCAEGFVGTSDMRENIADLTVVDGKIQEICLKREKINGKILSLDQNSVEVEGHGRILLAKDYKAYQLYNQLTMCSIRDLVIGYNYADFVIENGEVCGILILREEAMDEIRVLIKTSDYAGTLHQELTVSADTGFTIQYGGNHQLMYEKHSADEEVLFTKDSLYFGENDEKNRVFIVPDVMTGKILLKNVHRGQGIPAYRGLIELLYTKDGIVVINEVLLEEYLYSVVPSEMPSSYPNEALKAQAICARTYAYGHMMKAGYSNYGAHVDDSTSYQVYNNTKEKESTTTAVKETFGQLLYTEKGMLADTFYYSTSCGVGSDATVWKTEEAENLDYLTAKPLRNSCLESLCREHTIPSSLIGFAESLKNEKEFEQYISSINKDDFESSEGWYRWKYQVEKLDVNRICSILQKRYQVNKKLILTKEKDTWKEKPIEKFTSIHSINILKRGVGGVVDELILETNQGTYKVISEHNIRYVLNDGKTKVLRQDGSKVATPHILPSGFFVLIPSISQDDMVGYTLIGGGFGHGVGMSQNGAKEMAKKNYQAEQILSFFYDRCIIKNIYESMSKI